MPSWKKILQSGSAAHVTNITASALPNVSQPNIIGYDTASGRFTYFSTSSLGSGGSIIGGSGTTNYITRWSSNTLITTSSIYESGSRIGIGTGAVLPNAVLHISGASNDNLLRVSSPTATNALFISGSGNVGIGTTTPTTTLDVVGSIKATGFVASANVFTNVVRGYLTASFGATGIDFPTTAVVHISGASNDNLLRVSSPTDQNILFVSGSGNVGIGTTTPTNTLQVGGTGISTTNLTASSLPNLSQPNIIGYDTASGRFTYFSTASLTSSFVGGNGTTNYITRWSGPNTITTSSIYESGSRIGIGTTSSLAKLHVRGVGITSETEALRVENSNTSASLVVLDDRQTRITSDGAALFVQGAGVSPFTQNIAEFRYAGNGNSIIISQQEGVAGLTTSANANLNISPSGSGSTVFLLGKEVRLNNSNNNGTIALKNTGLTGEARLDFITGSSTIMSISSSGLVGIGTTLPSAKLHIYTNQSPHIGLFSRVENTSSATIASASSIQTKIDSTSGTITNAYNINILNSSASEGTISNLYGVHINLLNSGSGDNWAIFTSGSTKSYFGGNVGLNVTAPTYRLQVKGNHNTESLLRVEGSTNTFIDVTNGNVLVSGSNVHLSGSLYFSASSAGNVSNSVLVRDNTTGQIKLTGSYGGGGGGGVTLPSNLLSGSGTPTYIALYSGSNFLSSSNIFQKSNSFIGIGTNNPQTLLHIGGGFSADLQSANQTQVVVFNSSTKELTYMSTSSLVAGGGGTPGGINFDIQYNSNSTFGGTGAPQTFFYNYNNGGFGQGDGVSPSGSQSHTHGFYTITEDGAFYSHAEGSGSIVKAEGSAGHAEGQDTIVRGIAGHAEGYKTYVGIIDVFPWAKSGSYAHAEGYYTTASGQAAHSEGYFSWAAGDYSHAEGRNTRAYGDYSHAEGRNTATSASYAHSEGFGSIASASYSHAEGINTIAEGEYSHAEGNGTRTTSNGGSSHAEGASTISDGPYSHAEGQSTITYGSYSHAEGYNSKAWENYSHAEGASTNARAEHSHTEGYLTETKGEYSHAEGYFTLASGSYSHAEGFLTVASGSNSHAEGEDTDANAVGSHTEGYLTKTNGAYSHAEGESTNAIGRASHTEGYLTTASGQYSHAEGESTQAIGYASHTIGVQTKTIGTGSFAAGLGTVASGSYQNVIGKYNISSSAETASFIIGNGFSDTNRSNLLFAFGSQVQITGSLLVSGSITATNISGNFLQDRIISPVNAGPGEQTIAQVISGSSDDTIFKLIPSGLTIGSSSVIYSRYPLYTINGELFDIGWGIGAPPSYSLDVYGESNFGGSNPYEGSRNNNNIRPKSYGFSHGQSNQVTGSHSFTQGKNLIASSSFQHIVGSYNQQIDKDYSFVIGNGMPDDRSNILLAHGGPVLSTTPEVQITGSFSVTYNPLNPLYNNSFPFADVKFQYLSQSYRNHVLTYDEATGQIYYFSSSLEGTAPPPCNVRLNLSSSVGTDNQSVSQSFAITDIVYNNDDPIINVSGLPVGITYSVASTPPYTITIFGNVDPNAQPTTYPYIISNTYGCKVSGSIEVVSNDNSQSPNTYTLSGSLLYDNTAKTGMSNSYLELYYTASTSTIFAPVIGQSWASANTTTVTANSPTYTNLQQGYFEFTNIPPGEYILKGFTSKPWGGVTATDALVINRSTIGAAPLVGLRLKAADVNGSSTTTSVDALLVARRANGSISTFAAGAWVSEEKYITITSNTSSNVLMLCVGDVNGSYTPNRIQ